LTWSNYGIQDFDVQYWDGAAWQLFPGGHVIGANLVWQKFVSIAPILTQKVRLYITKAKDGYSRLVEFEAWSGGATSVNWMQNRNIYPLVSASSFHGAGYEATMAINGSRVSDGASHGWWNSLNNQPMPQTLAVDFQALRTITQINVFQLRTAYNNTAPPTLGETTPNIIQTWKVQSWDGANWIDVPGAAATNTNQVWSQFNLATPITTQKMQILVTAISGPGQIAAQIVEFECWGPS
jgi:hypothetical protein